MEIVVAKTAGFCFGVRRAVDIAFEMAKKKQKGIFTLGPIIHNPQVIESLMKKGIAPIEDISTPGIRTLIIRTHGIPLDLMDRISAAGHKVIDATCPFVKKAQDYVKLLRNDGYQVVILGDREHPEVKSLVSYGKDEVIVVTGSDTLPRLGNRVGIVVQTTQPVEALKKLLTGIIEHTKEVKVYNTICNSTALRLKETRDMAEGMDAMIVVGGKNSANTTQLAKLCASLAVPTYHIETAGELRRSWFSRAGKVGVTAGASTPEWIIDEVIEKISGLGDSPGRKGYRRVKGDGT